MESNKFNTLVIHGGQKPDPAYGAVMPPIYQTSTYAQTSPGKHQGYEYSRSGNPTRHALERALAAIEGGRYGLAFASGMAAMDTLFRMLSPGDEVITSGDLYGGSYRLFTRIFAPMGIKFLFVDTSDLHSLEANRTEQTRLVWLETPTNPLMNITDLRKVGDWCKANNILLAVDNTFATPFLQKPLALGATIVMHSATKYLGGHSDVVAGGLVVNDQALAKELYFIQNAAGAICSPMDSFLVLRGIKTLHVRMQRHCENATVIAEFLENHPKVERVYWPGLKTHPGHEIAREQMTDFGAMLSFLPKGAQKEDAIKIVEALKVFTLAESLGGVESLAGHPATMTHASVPFEKRKELGISDALVRLSVGIEDVEDLLQDLEQALAQLNG